LEQIRLGTVDVHVIFDPEFAERSCYVSGSFYQNDGNIVAHEPDVRHGFVVEMSGFESELCLIEDRGLIRVGADKYSCLAVHQQEPPVVVVFGIEAAFDATTAYWVLIIIGIIFTATEPYWMRNIYQRMMKRRYQNLDGFHTTR
jgi:hypothetical protein